MLIYVEVTIAADVQIKVAVFSELLEHVVKKFKSCINLCLSSAIKAQRYRDISFVGFSGNRPPARCKNNFVGDSWPIKITQQKTAYAKFLGKVDIRSNGADHNGVGWID